MKQILFFTVFVCSNPCLSQFERSFSAALQNGIYIYNNQKDTIYLSFMNVGLSCKCKDLQVLDSVQIDGIGLKEIIFHRKCRGKINGHGATFVASGHVNVSKYEIWNIDTKEIIFEATNFNKSKFDNKRGRVRSKSLICWSYDFVIDSIGRITISKLKTKSKGYNSELNVKKTKAKNKPVFEKKPYKVKVTSDKTEGTYRYVNGKYIIE
ncbi:MAG: hypothetical protein K9G31_09535 [Crocinitomicaceae bacterium]|nr:hypothetical protein [Crocinitomicaceae bacterium]MCF8444297.1 hypothetical protein [Crocinitomicaceae bacterium]